MSCLGAEVGVRPTHGTPVAMVLEASSQSGLRAPVCGLDTSSAGAPWTAHQERHHEMSNLSIALSRRQRRPRLVDDRRGAIMVIGLFMAVALAGSLWFILGIGDAIMVRDRAIEAADHAVFSAATVHARGMNYISALNLIMFAIACIYVAFCLLANIIIAIGAGGGALWIKIDLWLFTWSGCVNFPIGIPPLKPYAKPACELGRKMATAAMKVNNNLIKPAFKGLTALEDVVQTGFPIVAEVAAVKIAGNYNVQGFNLSPSLIPKLAKSDGVGGIGLPLTKHVNTFLCERTFNEVEAAVSSVVPKPFNKVINLVIDLAEYEIMHEEPDDQETWGIGCMGDPWTKKGIHFVTDGVSNGSDYLQMWGLVINAKDTDVGKAETKISAGSTIGFGGRGQTDADTRIYYAQAEYYFNCRRAWKDQDCYDNDLRNASFSMNWRARLRRVRPPSFGNKMIGLATEGLLAGNLTNFIAGRVATIPGSAAIAGAIQNIMNGWFGAILTRSDIGRQLNGATDFLTGADKPIH